jgi:hypothetical protein
MAALYRTGEGRAGRIQHVERQQRQVLLQITGCFKTEQGAQAMPKKDKWFVEKRL